MTNASPISLRPAYPLTDSHAPMIRTIASARPVQAFAALCILVLVTCPPAFAQSDDAPDIEDRWALQFGVTQNFTLNDFQGTLISAKKQYSGRRAFRVGLGFNASIINSTNDGTDTARETDQNNQSINATAQWIRYLLPESDLRAYWGGGPEVTFGRVAISRDTEGTDTSRLSLGGGATGVLGAEWFVHARISLSAEYRAELVYRWSREEQGESSSNTEHRLFLGGQGVLFGVSVYF